MSPEDRVRLRHIADGLDSAVRFTSGRKREDLDGDQMLVFALMHALRIVGEAASRISGETRDQCPEVPWASMIGMRHRLVHALFRHQFRYSLDDRIGDRSRAAHPDSTPARFRLTRW
jgi:uncharacterized protein with HEPN domain